MTVSDTGESRQGLVRGLYAFGRSVESHGFFAADLRRWPQMKTKEKPISSRVDLRSSAQISGQKSALLRVFRNLPEAGSEVCLGS
jgi:hypothetical protein